MAAKRRKAKKRPSQDVMFLFRLPKALHEEVAELAERGGKRTMASVIREAVEEFVAKSRKGRRDGR